MTINLQTGGYKLPQALPVARSADIQVKQKQETAHHPEVSLPDPTSQAAKAAQTSEEQRYEQVVLASKHMFKDVYPLGDKTLTFYKDANGQYVTRYTSLRDGRVTYVPELRLLQAFDASQRARKSIIEIQA